MVQQRPWNRFEKHDRHTMNEPDTTRLGRRATLRDVMQESRDLEVVRCRASDHEAVMDREQVLLVESREALEHPALRRG